MKAQEEVRCHAARLRRVWRVLAGVSCIVGAACSAPTAADDAGPPPTRWEIKPAASVDDGASYWPGAQWRTALPRQVGMDSAALATLSRDVRQRKWPTLRSLLVVHHGYLVFNEYVAGVEPESLQWVQDVTMTATGLLVGIAVREGKLRPDDGVPQFFPEYASLLASGFRNGIGLDHLLTMRCRPSPARATWMCSRPAAPLDNGFSSCRGRTSWSSPPAMHSRSGPSRCPSSCSTT